MFIIKMTSVSKLDYNNRIRAFETPALLLSII